MSDNSTIYRKSAFEEGLKTVINSLKERIQTLYLADQIPWVIGYSGGKDSTAVLQLVWYAIQDLAQQNKCHKEIHVISTDTLVENPIVAMWVERSLEQMQKAAIEQKLPIKSHRLIPEVKDRFWVNLIGKGYPAPRYKFRWCTDRLKIAPSNTFIKNLVETKGEAILVLGTRKAESTTRASTMEFYENLKTNTRKKEGLSANGELDRVWVFSPISDWSNDDVWVYLNSIKNPWDFPNQELMGMYQGATEGGECPLVIDKSTQSCGDSRFGCYVCTMVNEDKSMSAMIANDEEKEWMLPLLSLRNEIDINDPNHQIRLDKLRRDKSRRDFRRMGGHLTVNITKHGADLVPGPYIQSFREYLLAKLLQAELEVQRMGPPEVKNLKLITIEELEEIRRIWLEEKMEVEDKLPLIYESILKKGYPGKKRAYHPILNASTLEKLKEYCIAEGDSDNLLYQQIRSALSIEIKYKNQLRRANLPSELNNSIEKGAFSNLQEAKVFALEQKKYELQIQLDNSPDLTENVKQELQEQIDIISKSLKQQGYSSLLIEVQEISDDL